MTKFVKRFALVLCMVALCIGMLGVTAFAAYEPATASIPVEIALTGYLPVTPDTFQVELSADDAAFPMPEGAVDGKYTIDIVGASSGAFDITFDTLGVYTYTVKQLDLGNEDCYQDSSVYKIVVQVLNNSDYTAFELNVVVSCEEEKCDILFQNRYAMPTEVQMNAVKTMDGKTPKDGAFTFELVDAQGAVLETVANNETGDIAFLPISYYKAGQYVYTIREVKGTNKNIIYDETEFTAVVDVAKDENGDYVAALQYLNGEEVVEKVAFANKTKPIIPQTGDDANILLWAGLMAVALIAIVALLFVMKKKPGKYTA